MQHALDSRHATDFILHKMRKNMDDIRTNGKTKQKKEQNNTKVIQKWRNFFENDILVTNMKQQQQQKGKGCIIEK